MSGEDVGAMDKSMLSSPDITSEKFRGFAHEFASLLFGKENIADWKNKLWIIPACQGLFFILMVTDMFAGGYLVKHSIHPRAWNGLPGILWSPFLHENISQFLSSLLPFSILGAFVLMRDNGIHIFLTLSCVVTSTAGLAVWLFGQAGTNNCGSSLLVFGYFGYLLAYGVLASEVRAMLVATMVILMEGGLIWGLFPSTMKTVAFSWEGHLFGMLVGLLGGVVDARYGDNLRETVFRNPIHHCYAPKLDGNGATDLPDDFDPKEDNDIMEDDLA